MLCLNCHKNEAQTSQQIPVLPCRECQNRQARLPSPHISVEVIPDRIKAERRERQDSIEQPHFKGELNKRWVDTWGVQAAKEHGFTDKEIKKAKYTMDEARGERGNMSYYKNGEDGYR